MDSSPEDFPTVPSITCLLKKVFSWKLCILCQKNKKKEALVKTPKSLTELLARVKKLSNFGEPKYIPVFEALNPYSIKEIQHNNSSYHRSCYQSAMHPSLLIKWTRNDPLGNSEGESKLPSSDRLTRSHVEKIDKSLCFFCQSEDKSQLFNMSSFDIDAKVRAAITADQELLIRYNSAFDARAGDLKYHRYCIKALVYVPLSMQIDNSIEIQNLLDAGFFMSIEKSLRDGAVMSLVETTKAYDDLLQEYGFADSRAWTTKKKRMKDEINTRINNVQFVDSHIKNESQKFFLRDFLSNMVDEVLQKSPEQLSNDLSILVESANILRKSILDFRQKHNVKFCGSVLHGEESVPNELREFIKWVLSGGVLQGYRNTEITRRALTLSNLFLYNVISDRQRRYIPKNETSFQHRFEPLQVTGMGLAIRKHGRHKNLVNFEHAWGLAPSNEKCLQIETYLANYVLDNMENNNGIFIPANIIIGQRVFFHIDNADFREDTGIQTHVLLVVGFQESGNNTKEKTVVIPNEFDSKISKTLKKNNFGELKACKKPQKSEFVRTNGCSNFSLNKVPEKNDSKTINTLSWLLCRSTSYFLLEKEVSDESDDICPEVADAEVPRVQRKIIQEEKMFIEENEPIEIVIDPLSNFTHDMLVTDEPQRKDGNINNVVYKTLENTMVPKLEAMHIPSWSAFNSAISKDTVPTRTRKLYFPFVPGPASDYSAIYTALMLSQGISVHAIGEGERTVITMDLDLYERTYLLIQSRDDLRSKFVLRLGELHIIFAHIRAIGAYIDQSGIERSWLEGDCMGSVTVEQVLNCGHMKRAVNIHEATLISLYSILMREFRMEHPWLFCGPNGKIYDLVNKINNACNSKNWGLVSDLNQVMINELKDAGFSELLSEFYKERQQNYMFRAISTYMRMVERLLTFIRASRERDWLLHLTATNDIIKDITAMDRIKYRRMLPVYVADMLQLEYSDPNLWKDFIMNGLSACQNSDIPFTAHGYDQAGEHVNRELKVDGGIIGISNNTNARTRFMLTAPLLSAIYGDMCGMVNFKKASGTIHHQNNEFYLSRQQKNVKSITEVFLDHGLSFDNVEDHSLFNIITNTLIPEKAVQQIIDTEAIGQKYYEEFISNRLRPSLNVPIWDPIKKLKLFKFSCIRKSVIVTTGDKIKKQKVTVAFFGRCPTLASSNRGLNFKEVLGYHELHPVPSSLMEDDGSLISGSEGKPKLMNELGKKHKISSLAKEENTCHVLDGMYIVNKMVPKTAFVRNGSDLAKVFTDYIESITEQGSNIHVVFDTYRSTSLKNMTRKKRKKGRSVAACRVTLNSDLTKLTLKKLLLNDESKGYLASFLAEEACKHFYGTGKNFMVTYDNNTVGNMGHFGENTHEEADTMILYHVLDASKYSSRIIVHCSDTDVFVGLVSYAPEIDCECWMQVASDTLYDIKAVSVNIGAQRSKGLIALHVLTGCDITGKFRGKSKITWLASYLKANEETIDYLANFPSLEDPVERVEILERFVCDVFCPKTNIRDLGNARWMIWTQSKSIDKLPPTIGAFIQGIKRAWYAAKVLSQGHVLAQHLPDPSMAGWGIEGGQFEPITTEDPIAPESIIELVSCGCKKGCKSCQCSCRKVDLCCTDLCSCFEFCENTDPPLNRNSTE